MADMDTRSKRASSVGILLPFVLAPVLPDGSISQVDRQHIAWSYSGILATALVIITYLADVLIKVTRVDNVLMQPTPAMNVKAQPSMVEDVEIA